ncbi:unnamed protein product, partial [Heterotrigona itama]
QCPKSRFDLLEAISLALSPTTQCSSEEPLSRITKDTRLESHLVFSEEAAVPRYDTLTAKLGNSNPMQ